MASQALDHDPSRYGTTITPAVQNQLLMHPTMAIFGAATARQEKLIFGRAFTLIQHIPELFLGSTLKSNELKSKSITLLPTDDSEGDDNRRPSLRSLYTETQASSDGELDMALDLTSSNREIGHRSMG